MLNRGLTDLPLVNSKATKVEAAAGTALIRLGEIPRKRADLHVRFTKEEREEATCER